MTIAKQIEKKVVKIQNLNAKTDNLLKEIFGLQKKLVIKPKAVVKTKVTVAKAKVTKVRSGRDGVTNRSELIRAYFEKNGLESRPRDVIEAIKKSNNVDVAPALVSIIKHKLGGSAKKVVKTKAKVATKPKSNSDLPLPAVCLDVLSKNKDGLKLGDLANKVVEAGYKYGGEKGHKGLVQNVYQCLYSLSKEKHHPGFEGTDPVVLHDETSKRYMLNPKAKKSA